MRRAGIAPVLWMIPTVQELGVRWSAAAAMGLHGRPPAERLVSANWVGR